MSNFDWLQGFGGVPIYGLTVTQPRMMSNIDMANAQIEAARGAQQAHWSGMNPWLLQNAIACTRTQWDDDYDQAMTELDEIAPGWKE